MAAKKVRRPSDATATMPQIRTLLRSAEYGEGLTRLELIELTGKSYGAVYAAINKMPDIYIDRWQRDKIPRGYVVFVPVFCVIIPPENCPRPVAVRGPRKPRKETS